MTGAAEALNPITARTDSDEEEKAAVDNLKRMVKESVFFCDNEKRGTRVSQDEVRRRKGERNYRGQQ